MYKVVEFTNEQTYIDLFLSLPVMIYKGDKNYSRRGDIETVSWLTGKHKCEGFLKQRNLLVLHNDSPAARGIAFVNTIGGFGSIGFFECIEDMEAVKLLTDASKAFCRENGIKNIYAPMNGSIWSSYRLMTKGFKDRPFIGEPYNKPYYSELLTQCGYKVSKKWETQFIKKVKVKSESTSRYLNEEKVQQSKGIKVRNMKNFDEDIRIIYKLTMNSFAQFFLFHEITEDDFVSIYSDLRLIICDKRTVKIAYNQDKQPIGFGIALPDYKNMFEYILRYAKRYVFLYLGTLQEKGREPISPVR